jgi:hypothetical protein
MSALSTTRPASALRLVLLLLVGSSAAACIFDSGGDYVGGGRRGSGARVGTADSGDLVVEDGGDPFVEDGGDPFADVFAPVDTGAPVDDGG